MPHKTRDIAQKKTLNYPLQTNNYVKVETATLVGKLNSTGLNHMVRNGPFNSVLISDSEEPF